MRRRLAQATARVASGVHDRKANLLLRRLMNATAAVRRCRGKTELQLLFRALASRRARECREWLENNEELFFSAVAYGREVRPAAIRPSLEIVQTAEQRALFRFARFTSSLPFADRVGRRLRFLIRDNSLPGRPLMGIAALGSPVLDLTVRDSMLFGGSCPVRQTKHQALSGVAELYVAVGLRPYSWLLSGKLICYSMATSEVVSIHNRKYGNHKSDLPLSFLYCLSAYGPRSSQYNRLAFLGRPLYQKIGTTDGWSVCHINDRLTRHIRAFLAWRGIVVRSALSRKNPSRFHMIHRFVRDLGVRPEKVFFTGVRRAVYGCPLAQNFRNVLLFSEAPRYDLPSLDGAIDWWKKRWLSVRVLNEQVMSRVRSFDPREEYSARRLCANRIQLGSDQQPLAPT